MKITHHECRGLLAACDHRLLMADLFHALNQPLTMLGCSLELALRQPRTPEECREDLSQALLRVAQINERAIAIRRLAEAEDPGDELPKLSLEAALHEILDDLAPLAESSKVGLRLRCDSSALVRFEPHRLRQALFLLLEFALTSAATSTALEISLAEVARVSVLTVTLVLASLTAKASATVSDLEWKTQELNRRLGLAIARRTFEAAGGGFQAVESGAQVRLEIRLPAADGEHV